MLQRELASSLEIDTPMLSKIERGERKAKREMISKFAELFNEDNNNLLTLWLADQICEVTKDEEVALGALQIARKSIVLHSTKNIVKAKTKNVPV